MINKIVFITRRGTCYHTDRECLALNEARNVHKKSPTEVDGDIPVCKRCSDDYTPSESSDTHKLQKLLEELDPDDI